MNFSEKLNAYIEKLDCSSKELSEISGLSSTVISRYRSGERTPSIRGNKLEKLVDGLYKISISKKIHLDKDEIYSCLLDLLNGIAIDQDELSKNFNSIITTLNISISDLSRSIGYDASFISKIRTGTRTPSKPQDFISSVCDFVISKYNTDEDKEKISILINCDKLNLSQNKDYYNNLRDWFSTNFSKKDDKIESFLKNLDEFDLQQYINKIHFNDLKIPFVPFYKAISKNYYGIEEMKEGELDFFKATVLSKSTDDVFMCSDMPMEDMAQDIEFGKKWMFAIAMMLKKGLHLNIIHNVDRPLNEMMLGLESWIPIYMTGQISPYYLKNFKDNTYCHFNYTSGAVALSGECIKGYHKDGKYYLTCKKNEVEYFKKKCENLLKKASHLMEIYTKDSYDSYNNFIYSNLKMQENRRRILSSLPIHTISDELITDILKRNKVDDIKIKDIIDSLHNQKKITEDILKQNILEDEIPKIPKEEFDECKPCLSLSFMFFEKKIYYNYDEYLKHLELTKKYAKSNKNYKLKNNTYNTFKNIEITICGDEWVMISKITCPSIHFVIDHPKLRESIKNFVPPIIE